MYERYGKRLFDYGRYTYKINEDDCWDLVYKTLYKVLESIDRYEFASENKFKAFLFTAFINYLRNHYRDKKNLKEHIEFAHFNESQFDEEFSKDTAIGKQVKSRWMNNRQEVEKEETPDSKQMSLLKEELDKMEDWQRMLLLLRAQNMPYSEIEKFVGKPTNQENSQNNS